MSDASTNPLPFIEYITGLCGEGETSLLGKQIAKKDADGNVMLHADGMVQATWPPFLPGDARIKSRDSWYVNTGSFILDRMYEKVGANRDNCEYVLFMMLDDVGTDKVPNSCPLPPTWIMETSKGSLQHGYAFDFDEQPTKHEFAAAIKAIAAAGFTDKGAVNAVRWCRIPGSVNVKPGRDGFKARLVEFHPDREYSLPTLCKVMGIDFDTLDVNGSDVQAVRLADTGSDNVLKWLSDTGLVLEDANSTGWYGVVCPNSEQHTDGNPAARYNPLNRGFVCYHGHCDELDSATFLQWVGDNGGPSVGHGLRDDVLADRLRTAMETANLQPNDMFTNVAAERIEEVEREQMSRVERSDLFHRFAYVMSDDAFFDVVTRRVQSRKVFNAMYRKFKCVSMHSGKTPVKIEPSVYFDERRDENGALALYGVTYAAGEDIVVYQDGLPYGNVWTDARPHVDKASKVSDADVKLWLDHCAVLVPDAVQLRHCLDVMAFKLQNPKAKINHAVLHGGDEGSGKDTMWAPVIWAVSGPSFKNRKVIDDKIISNQFTSSLETEILILNELREPEARERRAMADKLKPIIAAPPETLTVNKKFLQEYEVFNRLWVLSFTNHPVPISLPSQDRRWFCIWSDAPRLDPAVATRMWNWYRSGGFEQIAGWLYQRDVSKFNPSAAPIDTDWHRSMIENGRSNAESYLVDLIRDREGPFASGVIGAPWNKLLDQIVTLGLVPQGTRLSPQGLLHSLKEAGWQDMGRLGASDAPSLKQVFATTDMANNNSKSDLRRMVEPRKVADKLRAVA